MAAMIAKKDGVCEACGQPIRSGVDKIVKDERRVWVHETCPAPADEHTGSTEEPGGASALPDGDDRSDSEDAQDDAAEPTAAPAATSKKSAQKAGDASALPADLSVAALRRMLAKAEQEEVREKREKHLARLRTRRSTLVEELFAHYSIAPVEGDRNEVKRLAQLREKVLGDAPVPAQPDWHDASKSEVVVWHKDDGNGDEHSS